MRQIQSACPVIFHAKKTREAIWETFENQSGVSTEITLDFGWERARNLLLAGDLRKSVQLNRQNPFVEVFFWSWMTKFLNFGALKKKSRWTLHNIFMVCIYVVLNRQLVFGLLSFDRLISLTSWSKVSCKTFSLIFLRICKK